MSNINKQALRNTADRDWFESWFKSEFHPDKTGPYIKDQLFFAIQAARKPLLDELEAAEKRIEEVRGYNVDLAEESRQYQQQVDELNDALCQLLPGVQYMDPPDGGSVTPLEQVRRMVADYRERISDLGRRHHIKPCPKCNGTGMADSGGTQPWGEPIEIECDCRLQDANTAELVAAGIITKVGE